MKRAVALVSMALVLAATAAGAGGFSFDSGFTPGDFESLADALADAIVFPSVGPAAAGGVLGFDAMVVVGGARADTSSHWWRHGVDGSTVAGVMAAPRGVVRKGLPLGLALGAQLGQVLGERFVGGELRWSVLEGGVLSPAVALRASYSRLHGAPFDLEVAEAQLLVSKGAVLVTPYAALGYRGVRGDAFFGDPAPRRHRVSANRVSGAAGVRLSFVPFRLVAEVRQAAKLGYFLGFGIGL